MGFSTNICTKNNEFSFCTKKKVYEIRFTKLVVSTSQAALIFLHLSKILQNRSFEIRRRFSGYRSALLFSNFMASSKSFISAKLPRNKHHCLSFDGLHLYLNRFSTNRIIALKDTGSNLIDITFKTNITHLYSLGSLNCYVTTFTTSSVPNLYLLCM